MILNYGVIFHEGKKPYLNKSFQIIIIIIIIIIITNRTVTNSRHQRSTLSSCSNSQQSHNPYSSVTENLQKNTEWKAELISVWHLKCLISETVLF